MFTDALLATKKDRKFGKAFFVCFGETKLIEINLPKAEKSQVYQAFWSFVSNEGLARSFNMPFRWTTRGQSGRIEKVSLVSPLKKVYLNERFLRAKHLFGSKKSLPVGEYKVIEEVFKTMKKKFDLLYKKSFRF